VFAILRVDKAEALVGELLDRSLCHTVQILKKVSAVPPEIQAHPPHVAIIAISVPYRHDSLPRAVQGERHIRIGTCFLVLNAHSLVPSSRARVSRNSKTR